MNLHHQVFITEMLQHGDKDRAYSAAYPRAKGRSITEGANRLLSIPEIDGIIQDTHKRIRSEVEEELKAARKKEMLTVDRMKEILTGIAEGETETIRHIRTRQGIEKVNEKPAHWHMLKAIDSYCRLTGEFSRADKQVKEEPPVQINYEVFIDGMPMDECNEKMGGLREAYYDEDSSRRGFDPEDSNTMEQFMEIQAERAEKRDREKNANSTPEYLEQEKQALEQFSKRSIDSSYLPAKYVIDMLWDIYRYNRDETNLKNYKALQKMVGLQHLPHRHRWEAELDAGWEFHPYECKYIRKSPGNTIIIPPHGTTTFYNKLQQNGTDG